jgi:hypothetical protein
VPACRRLAPSPCSPSPLSPRSVEPGSCGKESETIEGLWWIGAGIAALGFYGLVATRQPFDDFGCILAAYGGVFVAGSLTWA